MELELAKGVQAFIQPTKKFKTVLIEYKFRSKYDPQKATARTLIKNMLVTNSKKYPTQKAMDQHMSWLYGASLGAQSQRYGHQHVTTFQLRVVNDKYIGGDDTLLEQAFCYLEEIIFQPNAENGAFHEMTFLREKENLENYFDSLEDNKAGYALFKLNQLLYNGTDQQYLGIGDQQYLTDITPGSAYAVYQEMIQTDTVDIFVSGDVEYDRISSILDRSHFDDREKLNEKVFIHRSGIEKVTRETEEHEVSQGKLLLGFSSPIYYMEQQYFAAMIFNGLFGGFPHSKLFQNVREKESLAYSASSYTDFLRGSMIVQTGIEVAKKERVEEIVLEQLEEMKTGNFLDEYITQTKEMLINQYKQNDDNQSRGLSKIYLDQLLAGKQVTEEEWIESVRNVTKEEIVAVANQMQLQAVYFLKGVGETHA